VFSELSFLAFFVDSSGYLIILLKFYRGKSLKKTEKDATGAIASSAPSTRKDRS
jgi:hypothetical protein